MSALMNRTSGSKVMAHSSPRVRYELPIVVEPRKGAGFVVVQRSAVGIARGALDALVVHKRHFQEPAQRLFYHWHRTHRVPGAVSESLLLMCSFQRVCPKRKDV